MTMALGVAVMEQHLRRLRRYASILTGSKETADRLILNCLEDLAPHPGPLRLDFGRVDLFRKFHDTIAEREYSFCLSDWPALSAMQTEALGKLACLSKRDRAVLLLRNVEQFEVDDVARIMGLPRGEISRISISASKILAGFEHHLILIIEDEFFIARDLSRIVTEMGHTVCGIVGDADTAIKIAESQKPSLLLADLRLANGEFGGVRAAEQITAATDIPVVFVTAYPDQAEIGRFNRSMVIRKPFHPASVVHAVEQALNRRGTD